MTNTSKAILLQGQYKEITKKTKENAKIILNRIRELTSAGVYESEELEDLENAYDIYSNMLK